MSTLAASPPARRTPARAWALRVTAGVVLLGAVVFLVTGASYIVDDQRSHTDEFDGLGTFVGLLAIAMGAVWCVVGLFAPWLTRQGVVAAGVLLGVFGLVFAFLGGVGIGRGGGVLVALGFLLVSAVGFTSAFAPLRSSQA